MRSSGFSAAEKSAVTATCRHLIDDFLKPRFLPTIRPTQFNYPVDILVHRTHLHSNNIRECTGEVHRNTSLRQKRTNGISVKLH